MIPCLAAHEHSGGRHVRVRSRIARHGGARGAVASSRSRFGARRGAARPARGRGLKELRLEANPLTGDTRPKLREQVSEIERVKSGALKIKL